MSNFIRTFARYVYGEEMDIERRCRPGMGRCQGGFCGPRVQEILSRELNRDMTEIVQEKSGSYILTGKTK